MNNCLKHLVPSKCKIFEQMEYNSCKNHCEYYTDNNEVHIDNCYCRICKNKVQNTNLYLVDSICVTCYQQKHF